jgi:hypothetical protein
MGFLALAAAAVAMFPIAALLLRRAHTRAEARWVLVGALLSDDPDERLEGLQAVGAIGLKGFAGTLEEMTRTETDPRVVAALVQTIIQKQWEPADPHVAKLREWAAATAVEVTDR